MMNEDLTCRFTECYNHLKNSKKVKGSSDFAQKIEVSASVITDIRKMRSKPGVHVLRGIIKAFPEINPTWLLTGEGEMLVKNAPYPTPQGGMDVLNEPETGYYPKRPAPGLAPEKPDFDDNASPTRPVFASPTASPTTDLKDQLILQQAETIAVLKESLAIMRSRLDDLEKRLAGR
jgi:hypothetical protein